MKFIREKDLDLKVTIRDGKLIPAPDKEEKDHRERVPFSDFARQLTQTVANQRLVMLTSEGVEDPDLELNRYLRHCKEGLKEAENFLSFYQTGDGGSVKIYTTKLPISYFIKITKIHNSLPHFLLYSQISILR